MLEWFRSDAGIYISTGAFAILVFVVAVAIVTRTGEISPSGSEFSGLLIGFGAFMAVYFVSLGVWHVVSN